MIPFERDRTSIRYRVLDHITMYPGKTTQEIADATGITHRRVKSACDYLQVRGYITNVALSGNHRPRRLIRRDAE
jgi:DNA-binding MarR family transcriptional regulator